MSNKLTFQSTALVGTNKMGIIKPDANGYYPLVLGAFNYHNGAGDYYPLEPVKKLLLDSSSLMRRISKGVLRGELGHPKQLPGMTSRQFLSRISQIDEQSICCHIKSIELDEQHVTGKDGKTCAAIIGMVKPSGPFGESLEKQLQSTDENVYFSIRSITDDHIEPNGTRVKKIVEIITWDNVNEGGIDVAHKFKSPSLESYAFDYETVIAAKEDAERYGIGTESAEVLNSMVESITVLGKQDVIKKAYLSSQRWV